jgi:transposase
VLDGLPAHKTPTVKDCVSSTNGKLTLHFLPGYAPELNPGELAWSHVKRTGGPTIFAKRGETRVKIHEQLAQIQRDPNLINSFFQHPDAPAECNCTLLVSITD